jgi:hypothetical protein
MVNNEINEENGWIKAQGRRWDPMEGESLQGVFLRTERIKSKDPKKKDLLRYFIRNQEGLEITVFGTTILDDLFLDVPIQSEVLIKFTGTSHNKPPLSPTKLFEVFYRPQGKWESTPAPAPVSTHEGPSLNSHDPAEIGVFIQGVETDLEDRNAPITELNMLREAKSQIGDNSSFWELVKEEITAREYPPK